MQERESAFAIDGMRAVMPLNFCCLWDTKHCISTSYFCKLPSDPVVEPNTVIVPTLHHKRTWSDAHGHFAVVEAATLPPNLCNNHSSSRQDTLCCIGARVSEIPILHLPFGSESVASLEVCGRILGNPIVEIRRADGACVSAEKSAHPASEYFEFGQQRAEYVHV